jgi:hypothetical protein
MKKLTVATVMLAWSLFCLADPLRAQAPKPVTSQAPIVPMEMEFSYAPQYFMQLIEDNARYSRIEALINDGQCEVILTDKTMNKRVFYANSQKRIDVLQANGAEAYLAPVEVGEFTTVGSSPIHRIRLQDTFGQKIQWQFVVGEVVPHARPEIMFQSNGSGLAWVYAPHRAAPAAGTAVTIGARQYQAQPSGPGGDYRAFYSADAAVAQFVPATELWSVEKSPVRFVEAEKWDLRGEMGQKRLLVIKRISDQDASIEQIDLNDPDSADVLLDLDRSNGGFALRSMSITSHSNTLWIFFGPELPLPADGVNDELAVTFTVAENELASIANGTVTVRRAADAEHMAWQFDEPPSARGEAFETGVNLIPSSSEQAEW